MLRWGFPFSPYVAMGRCRLQETAPPLFIWA
jgi:hypothetical protein